MNTNYTTHPTLRNPSAGSTSMDSMDLILISPRGVKELSSQYLQGPIEKRDEGGTSIIFKCKYNGIDVAIKQLKTTDQNFVTGFDQEIAVHASLQHVNIVKVYGVINGIITHNNTSNEWRFQAGMASQKLLVCEYCGGGNLRVHLEKLAKGERSFFELDIINYLEDISRGLDHVHGFNNLDKVLIHGDLKPENIFLEEDFRRAKLGDFGLACELKRRSAPVNILQEDGGVISSDINFTPTLETLFATSCTMYYTAPECFDQQKYVRQSDVYSFGMVLYNVFFTMDRQVMYCQRDIMGTSTNFQGYDNLFRQKVINGYRPSLDIKPILPYSSSTINEMKNLIQKCWDPDYAKRPRFDQITAIFVRLSKCLRTLLSNATKVPVLDISSFGSDRIVTQLGHGGMGIAYQGTLQIALKRIIHAKHATLFQREIDLQAMVVHENIVKVLGISHVRVRHMPKPNNHVCQLEKDAESMVMVSELCANGNLLQYLKLIRKNIITFDENRLVSFMLDITRGMEFLHSMRIIHKDLKTENIFLHNNYTQAKIGDFGIARVMKGNNNRRYVSATSRSSSSSSKQQFQQPEDSTNLENSSDPTGWTFTEFEGAGSLLYISPECLLQKHASRAMDVYSFGIILHNAFITQDNERLYNQLEIIGDGPKNSFNVAFIRQFERGLRPKVPDSINDLPLLSPPVYDVILPMIRECLRDITLPSSPSSATPAASLARLSSSSVAAEAVEEVVIEEKEETTTAVVSPIPNESRRPTFQELRERLEKLRETLLLESVNQVLTPFVLPAAAAAAVVLSPAPAAAAVAVRPLTPPPVVAAADVHQYHNDDLVNLVSLTAEIPNLDHGPPSDLMIYGDGRSGGGHGCSSVEHSPLRLMRSSSQDNKNANNSSYYSPSAYQLPDEPSMIDSVRYTVDSIQCNDSNEEYRSFQMIAALNKMKGDAPLHILQLPLIEFVQGFVEYLGFEEEQQQHESGKLRDKVYRIWVNCGRPPYQPQPRQKLDLLAMKRTIFQVLGIQEQGSKLTASLQEVAVILGIGTECSMFTTPNEKACLIAEQLGI